MVTEPVAIARLAVASRRGKYAIGLGHDGGRLGVIAGTVIGLALGAGHCGRLRRRWEASRHGWRGEKSPTECDAPWTGCASGAVVAKFERGGPRVRQKLDLRLSAIALGTSVAAKPEVSVGWLKDNLIYFDFILLMLFLQVACELIGSRDEIDKEASEAERRGY